MTRRLVFGHVAFDDRTCHWQLLAPVIDDLIARGTAAHVGLWFDGAYYEAEVVLQERDEHTWPEDASLRTAAAD